MAVGAAATAVAAIGFSLLQFLLGVEAPVSLLLRAPDPDDDRAQHAARAARLRDHAAACCCRSCPTTRAAAGAGPTRPAASARSRAPRCRRASRSAVPPITPQLAWRVAVLGGVAFVLFAIVFFRLWFLQVLTGEDYVRQARENRVRKVRIEAPRGDIVDRNGRKLVHDAGRAGRADRARAAARGGARRRPTTYRKALAAAESARLRGRATSCDALERELRDDGRKDHQGRAPRAPPAARAGRDGRAPVAGPAAARRRDRACGALYRRLGRVIGVTPAARSTSA